MLIEEQGNSSSTPIKKEKNTRKAYWTGKKRSEETKKKIRDALKCRRVSIRTEFKKGNPGPWLGKKRDPEMVKRNADKIRGIKFSKERLKKHIEAQPKGKDKVNWKGEEASMVSQHAWVKRCKGKPQYCNRCGLDKQKPNNKRTFEWANISGKYKRDLNDYEPLCIPCHRKQDSRRTKNLFRLTAFGETKGLTDWSEDARCKVSRSCLYKRITYYKYL